MAGSTETLTSYREITRRNNTRPKPATETHNRPRKSTECDCSNPELVKQLFYGNRRHYGTVNVKRVLSFWINSILQVYCEPSGTLNNTTRFVSGRKGARATAPDKAMVTTDCVLAVELVVGTEEPRNRQRHQPPPPGSTRLLVISVPFFRLSLSHYIVRKHLVLDYGTRHPDDDDNTETGSVWLNDGHTKTGDVHHIRLETEGVRVNSMVLKVEATEQQISGHEFSIIDLFLEGHQLGHHENQANVEKWLGGGCGKCNAKLETDTIDSTFHILLAKVLQNITLSFLPTFQSRTHAAQPSSSTSGNQLNISGSRKKQ
ncbi:hypothetical protein CpipJ_CPIJ001934 [Culex quinquefasciatus]|uniref:Uncharacterized protein n=1 Tax=Culex quinquefasciatus TaxID=7176 RepID=B0W4S7_CULQU|nr:hypothetical protein CpipJ_CPIJ001934 [Culex quinquefasciatus]|eukprot:XP_001843711.1 hypothetical protein CpipJ_CPIJ001934 [Culex quinquefasciatus]